MQTYAENSPEAMAQLLTALMAADDRIDDAEVEALSILDAYARVGITPAGFADVLRDYFSGTDMVRALDRVDCIGSRITDPRAQAILWELMAGLANADQEVGSAEIDFLERLADAWWNASLSARLAAPGRTQGSAAPDRGMAHVRKEGDPLLAPQPSSQRRTGLI